MAFFKNIVGQRFGRLVVLRLEKERSKGGLARWLCICDCGQKHVVNSSNLRSKHVTSCGCFAREKSAERMTGENNLNWKGEKIKYNALHSRMYYRIEREKECKFCKKKCKTDLANISQKYKHTLSDWMWLCRSCHRRYDSGWKFRNKKWYKFCKKCKKIKEVNKSNFYQGRIRKIWFPWCKVCYAERKNRRVRV